MYKLYNVKAWGSLSIHCLLEEMEVPYTNIWMTPEQVRAFIQDVTAAYRRARDPGEASH